MRQYVVDAFTGSVFHGNQAAVCVFEKWPSEELMSQTLILLFFFKSKALASRRSMRLREKFHRKW